MWLGLLLFIGICLGLMMKWRYIGVIVIFIIVIMETEYYERLVDNQIYGLVCVLLLIFAVFAAMNTIFGWTDKT
jgi:hypothetical protein